MNDELSVGNIAAIVDRQAARRPAAPAILMPDRVIGYRQLSGMVHAVSRVLLDGGVRPGQTIGILSLNQARPPFAAAAPFGGWKASGQGIPEHGRWDRDFYSRAQAVYGSSGGG